MPKFTYRLQSYLNLKLKMEDQRKLEYGQAMAALERARAELGALETRRAETISDFRETISRMPDPQWSRLYNDFISSLKELITIQAKQAEQAEAEAERRRSALAEAMKERKALETLREKQYAEYMREQVMAEQKAADELVSFRQSRRDGEE